MITSDLKINFLPVKDLRFDPDNPRLPSSVKGENEEAVLAYLLRDATLIELMGSIGEQNFFAGEPLLVCANPTEAASYLVVEGNRRLGSVKLLNNPELAPTNKASVLAASKEATHKPSALPAVIYPNREAILGYLSYRHITGVKPWNPLQKARYLAQLRSGILQQPLIQQFRTLAKSIGTKSDYVARLLTGHSIYNEIVQNRFYDIPRLNEDSFEFSILTTALQYSNISNFLGLDGDADPDVPNIKKAHLKELTHWVFERNDQNKTRLGESRNLKDLSRVVANQDALKAFRSGLPLVDAKDLTDAPAQLFQQSILQARERLTQARDNLHRINRPTKVDEEILGEVISIARDIRTVVSSKIADTEDAEA